MGRIMYTSHQSRRRVSSGFRTRTLYEPNAIDYPAQVRATTFGSSLLTGRTKRFPPRVDSRQQVV